MCVVFCQASDRLLNDATEAISVSGLVRDTSGACYRSSIMVNAGYGIKLTNARVHHVAGSAASGED